MKDKTLHMIGNAHIDPVWLWRWQEGFLEVRATFRSALDRLREYEDFVFVSSSAAYYEWIEQNDPGMFAEIQQRVAEGRWQLVGGWWIQPDCNIPGGESFVRQGLYAQRYFKQKFDKMARVGYNVDSFGHHGMLPQLLKKSGMDYYVFMRPMPHEKGLPGRLFWWEADDCSRVLAFRLPFEYTTWGEDLEKHVQRVAAELKQPFDESMCFYGVGNHGGGPTKVNLDSIRRLQADPNLPRLVFSDPQRFFDSIQGQNLPIPVVHDDLQHHSSGCYSAHSGIKRWNRQAENLLLSAEKFASLAAWTTDLPYPAGFEQAWKGVLFNQFHDILAGTCIEEAYEDARDLYGEARSIAGRALNNALQSLAWNIRIPQEEGSLPLVVFNPHAWQSQASVEVELGRWRDTSRLVDDQGQTVPAQLVQSAATANGRYRLSFLADLPPLGYRTYRVLESSTAEAAEAAPTVKADHAWMENDLLRVEFDPATGAIARLFDKRLGVSVFSGLAARPVVLEDGSDTWSHNIFQYNQVAGCFDVRSIRLVEHGPVKATIRVESAYGASRLVQDFSLYQGLPRIDVSVMVDWREEFKMLKLRFPANLSHMSAVNEIPYGHILRFANGEEQPGQSWVDLSGMAREAGVPYGVAILNDGKYSFDVNIRDIGLTVLRSPIYAHHMPAEPQPERQYSYIDQGIQRFRYTILPHPGSWESAGVVQRAAELNQPPLALLETYHPDGSLPQSASFLRVNCENVIATALKRAEDGEGLVLRLVEMAGQSCYAKIDFPYWQRSFEATFTPCEIKTVRISREGAVRKVNLLEFDL